jgi:hypothetical protein
MTNIQEITANPNAHAQEYGTTRKEKYLYLSNLSKSLNDAIEEDELTAQYFEDCEKTNDILKKYYKNKFRVNEFNTFLGWKENGFKVKKGAKAFLFWSKPKVARVDNETGKKFTSDFSTENEDEAKDKKYFLSYLFSDAQVDSKKFYEFQFNNNPRKICRCSGYTEEEAIKIMKKQYPNDKITNIEELE